MEKLPCNEWTIQIINEIYHNIIIKEWALKIFKTWIIIIKCVSHVEISNFDNSNDSTRYLSCRKKVIRFWEHCSRQHLRPRELVIFWCCILLSGRLLNSEYLSVANQLGTVFCEPHSCHCGCMFLFLDNENLPGCCDAIGPDSVSSHNCKEVAYLPEYARPIIS